VRATVTLPLGKAKLGGFARVEPPSGRALDVKVPMGIDDGTVLRLRGLGAPGPNGGEPGDALITVEIA
jgi:DnaJ-class molecular chaperone